jgi:hypothetical protein
MKKALRAILLGGLALLAGCSGGGGGDSSTGGGGGATPLTGIYQGTLFIAATGAGGTQATTEQIALYVTPEGVVQGFVPSDFGDLDCSSPSSDPVLGGNTFPINLSATCNVPDLGQCTITITGTGKIEGDMMSGSGTFRIECAVGAATGEFSFTATRTSVTPSGGVGASALGAVRGSVIGSLVSGVRGAVR